MDTEALSKIYRREDEEFVDDLLGCKMSPLKAWVKTLRDYDDDLAMVAEHLFRDFDKAQQKVLDAIRRDVGAISLKVEHWYDDPTAAHIEPVNTKTAVNQ